MELDSILKPVVDVLEDITHVDISLGEGEWEDYIKLGLLVKYVIPLLVLYLMGSLAYISADSGIYRWRSHTKDSVLNFISKKKRRKKKNGGRK
tara:strand:- start:337 stop:615 length:279 start_codon:yes stop_codon:yes gene_type:complete